MIDEQDDEARDRVINYVDHEKDQDRTPEFTHGSEHHTANDSEECGSCGENKNKPKKFTGFYSDITELPLNTPGPDDDDRPVTTKASGDKKDDV